jgi:hypothetical protein
MEEKMPRKKTIDNMALIKAVESGTPRRELMKQFGLKSPVQVTTYYLDALINEGRAKEIAGRQFTVAKPSKTFTVNKRGSLVIPREKVQELGYKVGNTFSISKAPKDGISLKVQ